MFTSITVSDLAPPASSGVPAPMSRFWPNRLSTPTIKKFSSPNCALGSTMSRESWSSAETRLSMLFFDDCHCQAPPVRARASTAISAAAARPAAIDLRRLRGLGPRSALAVPTREGGTRSARRRRARSGSSEGGVEMTGMTSVSALSASAAMGCQTAGMTSVCGTGGGGGGGAGGGGASGWLRVRLSSSGTLESPCTLAIRSATVTPSVW